MESALFVVLTGDGSPREERVVAAVAEGNAFTVELDGLVVEFNREALHEASAAASESATERRAA